MATAFIGSSVEGKAVAERQANELAARGIRPLPWWDAFRPGDLTIERLRQMADYVDLAVFVWEADETTWHRGQEGKSTRDNVLLEYGLFLAKLGRTRTGLLVRQGLRLPSDIHGLTVKFFENDIATPTKELAEALATSLRPKSPEIVPVYVDPKLHSVALDPGTPPDEWSGRSLYVTDAGAARWLKVANDPAYPLSGFTDRSQVQRLYMAAVNNWMPRAAIQQLDRVVSLGPGDARTERQFLEQLSANPETSFDWVPVDISHGLLTLAVHLLARTVAIPMGVVCDFEDSLSFAFDRITPDESSANVNLSLLVTCVGGTFANIDLTEYEFLARLAARLDKNDYLLIDAPLKGKVWSVDKDPRARPRSYSRTFKEFLAGGVADRLGIADGAVLNEFDERIVAEPVENDGSVAGTTAICIRDGSDRDRDRRARDILRFRRYDEPQLRTFFKGLDTFELLSAETATVSEGIDFMRLGVYLLKKT